MNVFLGVLIAKLAKIGTLNTQWALKRVSFELTGMATKFVHKPTGPDDLMLVDALGFLNANDQNEVRLPVVKFLASQRASSIQTLVTYFVVVHLVLVHRISLQHCRPVDYVQEPNAEL